MPELVVPNAYYASPVTEFVAASAEAILGSLAANNAFALDLTQRDAWLAEISVLKTALSGIDGTVFLEFVVPRIGSRIDAVVISGGAIVVLEFKVGERRVNRSDLNQVWDYALDLKNFHVASHTAPIFPVLVPTALVEDQLTTFERAADGVFRPVVSSPDALGKTLRNALDGVLGETPLDPLVWARAPYRPTPTIVDAAQALYAQHSVESITRNDAGAVNLAVTARRVEEIIDLARTEGRKAIVFVTGVPGAGKTLVGLDVATKRRGAEPTHAVFLSGNGPLVNVLREALTRDEVTRLRAQNQRTRKGEVQQKVKSFIQNVHHFRDAGLNDSGAPPDRVVIFDEAQRAWNHQMTADFMKRKRGRPDVTQSEPELLLSYMDRHSDWAVVICLVGGGQEINRGEAGISAWFDAVATKFAGWYTHISPNLFDSEYQTEQSLSAADKGLAVLEPSLHLSVSMRSFRAEHVSRFVKAVLDGESSEAKALFAQMSPRYPMALTRDLKSAKTWIRSRARGSERCGLVASSGAQRLKAHCVDVRVEVDPVHWFLSDPDDTRSSNYLEDPATEFQVQGLELDWTCVAWDADFRSVASDWSCHSFAGNRWRQVGKPERRHYLRNAYRVLLTRARQGMVIFVPDGDSEDSTRSPEFYDGTFTYLRDLGIPVL